MNKDLIDFLLSEMRLRPGMYLGVYSLSHLNVFLTGVHISCYHLDGGGDFSDSFFGENGFLHWSWKKYGIDKPAYRLDHYLDNANGNEVNALESFFNDLAEYKSERRR